MPRTPPPVLLDALSAQHGVITRSQMHGLGCSDRTIATLTRHGHLVRIHAGAYAGSDTWRSASHRTRHCMTLLAIQLACSDAVGFPSTAATVWGLPVATTPPRPLVIRPPGRPVLAAADVTRLNLPLADHTLRAGLAVTTLTRTVVDIAAQVPLAEALMTVDAALRQGTPLVDLQQQLETCQRIQGWARASAALAAGDPASESPLESLSRGRAIERGMPVPLANVVIRYPDGWVRVDELWAELGVIGECDGKVKYADPATASDAIWKEKRRHERLQDLGFEIARWGMAEVAGDGAAMEARFRSAASRQRAVGFTWPAGVTAEVPTLPGVRTPPHVVEDVKRMRSRAVPIWCAALSEGFPAVWTP
jgi:hypothetical protein